jgi:putative membrane-bound dehydrogenase-like protein
MRCCLTVLAVLAVGPAFARADTVQHGLRVAAGFEVTEFADSKLANDIYTLTLDPRGRVVVAGRGYLRILVDDDGGGRADRAIDFADGPKDGAMGLLWEGDTLYVTGDGGLRRYRDRDGDGRADGPPELIRAMKTGGEHASHALRRGPDGWLYVLCGDHAGIDGSYATLPTSPIRQPVAGCVVRFRPDFKASEVVADGFRNAYSMDFNSDGELFTFDADNERCVALPWYEPTRFYHVIPGRHYGWLAPHRAVFWRLPPYACDVAAPVATLGRGSPTGVACYRHVQFPARYRGGFFLLDWTFGKVYFLSLRRTGATYTCQKEVFLESVGDSGFAPTGLAVHPVTGDLYISIGGRGTRGAVYRVRYPAGLRPAAVKEAHALQPQPRSLDWHADLAQRLPAMAADPGPCERLHGLIGLRRHVEHFEPEVIGKAVRTNWGSGDPHLRSAAADLIAAMPMAARSALGKQAGTPLEVTTFAWGAFQDAPASLLEHISPVLTGRDAPTEARLVAVRLLQRALGDLVYPKIKGTVWEGYTPRAGLDAIARQVRTKALELLRRAFPTGNADVDRELARSLAMLQDDDPATLSRAAEILAATLDPVEQVHYLIVLARLTAARQATVTASTADALLSLDRRLTERHQNRDSNWPLRLRELYAELARRDPALSPALLGHREFGRPDHVLFTQAADFDRQRAARVFLSRARTEQQYPWNADLVALVGGPPEDESLPVLRRLWGKAGLDAALLPVLARRPRAEDRARFLAGLGSPELATVRLSLHALEHLPSRDDPTEMASLVGALGRLPESKEARQIRDAIAGRLRAMTGEAGLGADRQAWVAWLGKRYPTLAARLNNPDGVDVGAWERRRSKIDWLGGDARRGRGVFVKASCAACHSGGQALGPDLLGVTGRFSREDLLTAIVQPSRDVSPRYRTTLIETTEGKTYQGLVIYEAVDGLILQTATATVRVAGDQIASRGTSALSLMPAGLLDNLTDRDIADLFAYLRGLGKDAGVSRGGASAKR